MRAINATATRTLRTLISGLNDPGDARKVDTSKSFMAVCVEKTGPRTYSVAHYFEQNGDLMADPDVVFFHGADDRFYPIEITQHAVGRFARYAELSEDGTNVERVVPRAQADLAAFSNMLLRNIASQQELKSLRAA